MEQGITGKGKCQRYVERFRKDNKKQFNALGRMAIFVWWKNTDFVEEKSPLFWGVGWSLIGKSTRWIYWINKERSAWLVRMYKSKSTPDNAFCLCYTLYLESTRRSTCKEEQNITDRQGCAGYVGTVHGQQPGGTFTANWPCRSSCARPTRTTTAPSCRPIGCQCGDNRASPAWQRWWRMYQKLVEWGK